MGWFSKLFDSGIGEKATDAIINAGDAMFYTEEEKAIAAQKKLDFALKWLEATSSQNLARRYIAVIIVCYFLLFITAMSFALVFLPDTGKILYDVCKEFLFYPFSGIMAFYYATHLLRAKNG